jgi:hypothetical protein
VVASFVRFLEVAPLVNGQIVNVAGIARDAAVARPTVQGYFATLEDTLIGVRLPAWRKRAKVKEVARPKSTWRREYGHALKSLLDQGVLKAGHGVYTGSVELKDGPLRIWPILRFLRALAMGDVLD